MPKGLFQRVQKPTVLALLRHAFFAGEILGDGIVEFDRVGIIFRFRITGKKGLPERQLDRHALLQGNGIALAYIDAGDPLRMAWRGGVIAQEWPPMHEVPQRGGVAATSLTLYRYLYSSALTTGDVKENDALGKGGLRHVLRGGGEKRASLDQDDLCITGVPHPVHSR